MCIRNQYQQAYLQNYFYCYSKMTHKRMVPSLRIVGFYALLVNKLEYQYYKNKEDFYINNYFSLASS
jgi:hypothetical protein